jgi:glycosyltransferase involved in cell wall biosynthesis
LKCSLALWQKFLKVHRENPFDVVEAPEHLAEGIFPALTRICPLVIRLHTPHSKFVAEGYHNLVPSFDLHMVATLERTAMLEADVLSSPSVDLASYVSKDCGYDLSKIEIVRNPVDAQAFSPDGVQAISEAGGPIVLFAGRLEERKGIYHLISAVPKVLQKSPDARFVIVGNDTQTSIGKTSVLADLKSALRDSGASEAVNFVGQIPLSEMANYYRSADVCVVASLYDNAPYTVLEAMACGKPIVGCATGGIPEYIVDGETGLVVPAADPDRLAEAISSLLNDKPKRRALGAAARQRVLECFDRDLIARQAVITYELAIARHQSLQNNPLYRKPPQKATGDFVSVLCSLEESLGDVIYHHAAGLNCQRWTQLAANRPKLALSMVGLGTLRLLSKIPGTRSMIEKFAKPIERGLNIKEKEIHDTMRARLFSLLDLKADCQ